MSGARIPLTPDSESVLVMVQRRILDNPRPALASIASYCGMREEAVSQALAELARMSLVEFQRAHSGLSRLLVTPQGREVALDLSVVPALGGAQGFTEQVSPTQRAILNAVVGEELRVAGGAATRSHIRTVVRENDPQKPSADAVNAAIDELTESFLNPVGGSETSYRAGLRGLLASAWGTNVINVIDSVLGYLRVRKRQDPSMVRFSWGALRQASGLPVKALNLAYLSIVEARLGKGLFDSEGDYWWATPPDLDLLVEVSSAMEHIRRVLSALPTRDTLETPENKDVAASAVLARVHALLEPSEDSVVRIHEALRRLRLHSVVASAAETKFHDGHYRNAVLDACIAVESYIKERSGRRDLDGVSLMQQVFSTEHPILAVGNGRGRSARDEQQGFMQLFVGSVQAIRNPRAHGLSPDSAEDAFECIVLLSLLARRVDGAKRRRKKRKAVSAK